MLRESHLFACHKFLEEEGCQILTRLAKMDFRNMQEIEDICSQLHDYFTILEYHAKWEEEFIFKKFFTENFVSTFFEEHDELGVQANKISQTLKELVNVDLSFRVYKGKQIYLDFRIFYASNLTHFYKEETNFLRLLQEKATDSEIRAIDQPIYQNMNSNEIVEMLERLLPPVNISEKKNIIDDLNKFNTDNFNKALPKICRLLTKEEIIEVFG